MNAGFRRYAFIVLPFVCAFGVGFYVNERLHRIAGHQEPSQARQEGYAFIKPLLECENMVSLDSKYVHLQATLEERIADSKAKGQSTSASVYFRDLESGHWFGINKDEEFLPASLLKVPTAMGLYKIAEMDPSVLGVKLPFTGNDPSMQVHQSIPPKEEIIVGNEYPIEELIERSVIYSDNQANTLLVRFFYSEGVQLLMKNEPFVSTEEDFNLLQSLLGEKKEKISVRNYATFFRVLYNGSFLSHAYSEKLLKLLSRTAYDQALVKGIPEGIPVAHKFGESGAASGERQLHDCGIVYLPDHPYVLCLMTRGTDMAALTELIRMLSQVVYEQQIAKEGAK